MSNLPEQVEQQIEKIVTSEGLELVHVEYRRQGRGYLLRVDIDKEGGITLEDCQLVSQQVSAYLDVEDVVPTEYELQVSSPGLDRPLKGLADYRRFAGHEVDLTLKLPFQGRKKYRGLLQAEGEGWRLVYSEGKAEQALDFSLEEVREARLVPVVNFKGRASRTSPEAPSTAAMEEVDGGHRQ